MPFYNSIDDTTNFVISFSSDPQQDFGVFAKGYADAATILACALLAKSYFADYEAYPVVFLYRQAFELYLKGFYYQTILLLSFKSGKSTVKINVDTNTHRLIPLATAFQNICLVLFPEEQDLLVLAHKAQLVACEFEMIDRDSYSFRYPINTKKGSNSPHQLIINLRGFHQEMKELLDNMELVKFGFDIEESKVQEVYEIILEAKSLIESENNQYG